MIENTHVQQVAELVVLGRDEADPAGRVFVLGAVLHVHLEERRESPEQISETRFVRERRHAPLVRFNDEAKKNVKQEEEISIKRTNNTQACKMLTAR